jgi:hypothetical protein
MTRKLTLDEHLFGLVEGKLYTMKGWPKPEQFIHYYIDDPCVGRIVAKFTRTSWSMWVTYDKPNPIVQERTNTNRALYEVES